MSHPTIPDSKADLISLITKLEDFYTPQDLNKSTFEELASLYQRLYWRDFVDHIDDEAR